MKKQLIAALLLTLAQAAFAADLEYVGGNRYYCKGNDCALFDSIQNSRDRKTPLGYERRLEEDDEAAYVEGFRDGKASREKQ